MKHNRCISTTSVAARVALVLIFALAPVITCADDEDEGYRTFTSSDGKEIPAKIFRVLGDNVEIILKENERRYTLPKDRFSEETRAYIASWERLELYRSPRTLDLDISPTKDNQRSKQGNGYEMKTWDGAYALEIKNTSNIDLENLTVRWRGFTEQDGDHGDDFNGYKGSFKIELLRPGITHYANLGPMELVDVETWDQQHGNITYLAGPEWDVDLCGYWIRIYAGDNELVRELSSPSRLMEKHKWTDPVDELFD